MEISSSFAIEKPEELTSKSPQSFLPLIGRHFKTSPSFPIRVQPYERP